MIDTEKVLQEYIDKNDIQFEIRAINGDGVVIAKRTSQQSADDAAASAWQVDDAVFDEAVSDYAESHQGITQTRIA